MIATDFTDAVMAEFVPAIHAVVQTAEFQPLAPPFMHEFVEVSQTRRRLTAWMAGTSPVMTATVALNLTLGASLVQVTFSTIESWYNGSG